MSKTVTPFGSIPRAYETVLRRHVAEEPQVAFVAGPRQVGKTMSCRSTVPGATYLSADVDEEERLPLAGQESVAETTGFLTAAARHPGIVFDELHKLRRWKAFLESFFDLHAGVGPSPVTGKRRLDVYRRGGDRRRNSAWRRSALTLRLP